MKQIRKGIDLTIKWRVKLSDKNQNYDNLTLVLTDSRMNRIKISDISITDTNVVTGVFYGKDQRILGPYMATLWKKWGMKGQSCVDRIMAFELVPVCPPDNKVELQDSVLWTGVQGESAYQSWLNLGNTGTEEDFINDLRAKVTVDDSNKEIIESIIDEYTLQKFNDIEQDISKLQENIDGIENYDDTEIKSQITDLTDKVTELENKEDQDTIYDDSEIKDRLIEVENAISEIDLTEITKSITNADTVFGYFYENYVIDRLQLTNSITVTYKGITRTKTIPYNNFKQGIFIPLIKDLSLETGSLGYYRTVIDAYDSNCFITLCNKIPSNLNIKVWNNSLKTELLYEYTPNDYKVIRLASNLFWTTPLLNVIIFPNQLKINNRLELSESINFYTVNNYPIQIWATSLLDINENLNTIYDDSEIREQISELTAKVTELQNKPDNDTVYDDSEIKSQLSDLEQQQLKSVIISEDDYNNLPDKQDGVLYFITE